MIQDLQHYHIQDLSQYYKSIAFVLVNHLNSTFNSMGSSKSDTSHLQSQIANLKQSQKDQKKKYDEQKDRAQARHRESIRVLIQQQGKILKEMQKERKKTATKENMNQIINQTFVEYIENIKPLKAQINQAKKKWKYITVVGEISAGKSSIFNWIFKTKLQTGNGEVTDIIEEVSTNKEKKLKYYDCPGFSPAVDITSVHLMEDILSIDYAFVVTDRSFKNSHRAIQVLSQLIPGNLFLVRTQCDKYQEEELQKQILKDKDYLIKQFKIVNPEILCISSKKELEYKDNARFYDLIKNPKIGQ